MGFSVTGKQDQIAAIEGGRKLLDVARTLGTEAATSTAATPREAVIATEKLRAQLTLAGAHASHPEVARLFEQLHVDVLAAGDPIEAAYFQSLPRDRPLSTPELELALTLAGPTLSEEEVHALRLLDPLMSSEQRDLTLRARQADYERLAAVQKQASSKLRQALPFVAVFAPPTAGLAALAQAGLLTGTPLTAAFLAMSAAGAVVGDYMKAEKIRTHNQGYGVNRVDDDASAHELLRLYRRVAAGPALTGSIESMRATLRTEADFFEALLGLRRRAKGDEPEGDAERYIVAAFEGYTQALRAQLSIPDASGGSLRHADFASFIQRNVDLARQTVLAALAPKGLAQLSAGIRPERIVTADTAQRARDAVIQGVVQDTLARLNPALLSVIRHLEAKVDATSHQAQGDARQLTKAETDALRAVISNRPNQEEALAIAWLVHCGAVRFQDIWPDSGTLVPGRSADATAILDHIPYVVELPKGSTQVAATLDPAKVSQWSGLATAAGVLLLTNLAFMPWGLAVTIGLSLASGKIAQAAKEKALAANIEALQGKPRDTVYEALLHQYRDVDALFAAPSVEALRYKGQREAARIRELVTAATPTMTPTQVPIYDALLAFAKQLDALTTLPGADVYHAARTAAAAVRSPDVLRLAQNDLLQRLSVNDALRDPYVRLVGAKQSMLSAIAQAVAENRPLRNRDLFDQAQAIVELQQVIDARNRPGFISRAARAVLRTTPKGAPDPLHAFAKQVQAKPFELADTETLRGLAAEASALSTALEADLRAHWPIDETRAAITAGQLLQALTTRVAPLIGDQAWPSQPRLADTKTHAVLRGVGVPPDQQFAPGRVLWVGDTDSGREPHFKSLKEALAQAQPGTTIVLTSGHFETTAIPDGVQVLGAVPLFHVTGRVETGRGAPGSLSLYVDAMGQALLDSIQLDWGDGALRDVAMAATAQWTGVIPKRARLVERGNNGDCVYAVRGEVTTVGIIVTCDGLPKLDSIHTIHD